MKKILLVLVAIFLLVGCSSNGSSNQGEENTENIKVALLLSGNLGDMSFLDSAKKGSDEILSKYENVDFKVVEMGSDATNYESNVIDFSEEGFDIIIGSGWQLQEPFQNISPKYPDTEYILFDASVDYDNGEYSNVYSINYKVNEASYLAGVVAGKLTKTNKLGFLGGADGPGINDFAIGFIEGAKSVNKDIKVSVGYVGSFNDSPKAKEMALAQYNSGIDIIFTAAGGSGVGTLEAAKQTGNFAFGVDSDQAMLYHDSDPEQSKVIPVSVLKNVDASLVRAFELKNSNQLPLGKEEKLGIQENAVGLSDNEYYNSLVDENIRKEVESIKEKITKGEIEVSTSYGLSTEEIKKIFDDVRP